MDKSFWTKKQDIGPSARTRHAVTYDGAAQVTLLFGGLSAGGDFLGDTWAWDGQDWTQVSDFGPAGRVGHALAYDESRQKVVLFGGRGDASPLGDTWEWDGEAWTQVAESGPSARENHAMVFDAARGVVTLFGGFDVSSSSQKDTWSWDGVDWIQLEDTGPSARSSHAMAFDRGRSRVVVFGGIDGASAVLGDTWEWDGAAWVEEADFGAAACYGAASTFKNARTCLFGGVQVIGTEAQLPVMSGITWEWDGKRWTARQDIGPGPRYGHAMTFDTDRSRVVLFGGAPMPATPTSAGVSLGDTWELPDADAPVVGTGTPLASLTVTPASVALGANVTIAVTLASPAGAGGESVTIVDNTGNVVATVPIAAGQSSGQVVLSIPPTISGATLPITVPLSATSGGVTQTVALTITA